MTTAISDYLPNPTVAPYFLEDIHMLKNGLSFNVKKLFKSSYAQVLNVSLDSQYKGIVSTVTIVQSLPQNIQTLGPISLNQTTGEISHNGTINPNRIENVKIVVTDTSDSSPVMNINVQFHDSIYNVWMSPDIITTIPDNTHGSGFRNRFCIYARFNDGIIADITGQIINQDGFYWDFVSGTSSFLSWFRPTTPPAKQTVGIFYCPPGTTPRTSISELKAVLPSYLPYTGSIEGKVSVLTSHSLDVQSHGYVNNPKENYANVLFLADGYTSSQSNLFRKNVDSVVNEMRCGLLNRPWGDLSASCNFWSAFLPSQDAGGIIHGNCIRLSNTVGYEHITLASFIGIADLLISPKGLSRSGIKNNIYNNNRKLHDSIDWTQMNSTPSDAYSLSELINMIGYPTSLDQSTPLNPPPVQFGNNYRFSNLIQGWDTNRISEFTYNIWLLLYNRTCLEQLDTVFASCYLSYNQDKYDISDKYLSFAISPYRNGSMIAIKKFLSNLTYSSSNLGSLFFNSNGLNNNIYRLTNGDYVIIMNQIPESGLVGEHISREGPEGPYVIMASRDRGSTKEFKCDLASSMGFNRYKPSPQILPELGIAEVSTAIHEFSHNWLLDEYSGDNILMGKNTNVDYQNLQPKIDTIDPTSSKISGHKIKWLWPRIAKIALIKTGIPSTGTSFTVTVDRASPDSFPIPNSKIYIPFKNGDVVILRAKKLIDIPNPNHNYPMFSITVSGNQFTLTSLNKNATHFNNPTIPSAAFKPSDYINGETYIICPLWNDYTNPTHFLSLAHKNVIALIDGLHQEIVKSDVPYDHNIQWPDPDFEAKAKVGITLPDGTIIKWPDMAHPSQAVGLYAGGNSTYNEGIYHGTGICLMRNLESNSIIKDKSSPLTTSYLCPVCAYILVDSIDFTKHPHYDSFLETIYPK